jgi:hypothetical protein
MGSRLMSALVLKPAKFSRLQCLNLSFLQLPDVQRAFPHAFGIVTIPTLYDCVVSDMPTLFHRDASRAVEVDLDDVSDTLDSLPLSFLTSGRSIWPFYSILVARGPFYATYRLSLQLLFPNFLQSFLSNLPSGTPLGTKLVVLVSSHLTAGLLKQDVEL